MSFALKKEINEEKAINNSVIFKTDEFYSFLEGIKNKLRQEFKLPSQIRLFSRLKFSKLVDRKDGKTLICTTKEINDKEIFINKYFDIIEDIVIRTSKLYSIPNIFYVEILTDNDFFDEFTDKNYIKKNTKRTSSNLVELKEFKANQIDNNKYQSTYNHLKNEEISINNGEYLLISDISSNINQNMTFDSFVTCDSNVIAHSMCRQVSKNYNKPQNKQMIFIEGSIGNGKTHLLHAIANEVSKTQKNAINVAFIHSDRFAFLYIKAIRENKLTEFKEIFYNLDVLLFDDIQIIASKKSTINEFYFIVNHLLSRGKIVAITSNVPLTSLKLDIKILSFLHSGYIVDIKNPSIHLRREIIIKFAMDLNIIISDEIVTYLATNLYSNIREIEATMTKIAMFFTVKKQAMTINAIKMMLQDTVKNNIKTISTKDIISAVCDKLSVDKQDLLSDSRQRNISQARKIAMYLMKSLTTMSLKQITESLKRKSHVSVIQAIKDMELEQKNNTNIAVIIDEISHFLKS